MQMKKFKTAAIAAAVVMIAAGALMICAALAMNDFDIRSFTTMEYKTKTYDVNERFEDIKIVDTEYHVVIKKTDDGKCKVVSRDSDKIMHTVKVENDTLTVTRKDIRKWYERIGIFGWDSDMTVYVYLPDESYKKLYALSVSGNVTVEQGFEFGEAEAQSTSGNVDFSSDAGELSLKTTSGDIEAKNIQASEISVKTTSGKIEAENFSSDKLTVASTSGDIEMKNVQTAAFTVKTTSGEIGLWSVVAEGDAYVESVSGEVTFESCDAANIRIKTVSGDIKGTLLSDKTFITSTTSGDFRLPQSVAGAGTCEIKTTSGDAKISVG